MKYKFDKFSYIKKSPKEHLYDLTIEDTEAPIYTANGILCKNTGDASYSTMESALSVFIEQLRSFRFMLTQSTFNQKIFPTLARVHKFVKRKPSELSHNIRITGTAKDIPLKDLIIPDIQWHKQLQPQYDESYLSILATLEEHQIPIPLRVWAAAGGFSIEKLLGSLDEDKSVRQEIADWKKALKESAPAEEDETWGGSGPSKPKRLPSKRIRLSNKEKVLANKLNVLAKAAKSGNKREVQKLLDYAYPKWKDKNLPINLLPSGIS
jgi:hypothetical protein